MIPYRTPGVYFEWSDQRAENISVLRTDIAGFIGIAARGPLHTAVKVSSWTQFVSQFGSPIPQAHLAYAVRGYFENGGQECYIVRVANPEYAAPATLRVMDNTIGCFNLEATSPGVWGRSIYVTARRANADSANLFLRLLDGSGAQEMWRVPLTNDLAVVNAALTSGSGSSLVKAVEFNYGGGNAELRVPANYGLAAQYLGGGSDGLSSLEVQHFIGDGIQRWGLAVLETENNVSILAMPDAVPVERDPVRRQRRREIQCCDPVDELTTPDDVDTDIQREYPPLFSNDDTRNLYIALIGQCEQLKYRVAILDPYAPNLTPEAMRSWRNSLGDSSRAALYYPWLRTLTPEDTLRNVPPCGCVAGIYARVDLNVGVHKPPANERIEAVQDVTFVVDDVRHADLNDVGVNVIRAMPGRGIRVAGARTISSDALWRFVNVRRLLNMIERSIEVATQWMVYEPNTQRYWTDINRVVSNFLKGIWQRGMLDGLTPNLAYEVECNEKTNSPEETERGRVICQITVNPPEPAEFVIVRIGKTEGNRE